MSRPLRLHPEKPGIVGWLDHKLLQAGMTPSVLAEKTGLSESYIATLRSGRIAAPSRDVLQKLAVALNATLEDASTAVVRERIRRYRAPAMVEVQPPGAAFSDDWYVSRGNDEIAALSALGSPSVPAVIYGARLSGKTWLSRRILERWSAESSGRAVVQVDLRRDLSTRNPDVLGVLVSGISGADQMAGEALTSQDDIDAALHRYLSEPSIQEAVLAIDNVDELQIRSSRARGKKPGENATVGAEAHASTEADLFETLRRWALMGDRDPWDKLRLLLTVSWNPLWLSLHSPVSPFNIGVRLRVSNFNETQIAELAKLHGLDWSHQDCGRLGRWVGGHAFLLRVGMWEARRKNLTVEELINASAGTSSLTENPGGVWGAQLEYLLLQTQSPGERALIAAAAAGTSKTDLGMSDEAFERLASLGLLVGSSEAPSFANELYHSYFSTVIKK